MRVAKNSSAWRWGAPRLIKRDQLRSYLQINDEELRDRIKRGQIPGSMWGSDPELSAARWDRNAVDQAIDRASAIRPDVEAAVQELDEAFSIDRRSGGRAARSRVE